MSQMVHKKIRNKTIYSLSCRVHIQLILDNLTCVRFQWLFLLFSRQSPSLQLFHRYLQPFLDQNEMKKNNHRLDFWDWNDKKSCKLTKKIKREMRSVWQPAAVAAFHPTITYICAIVNTTTQSCGGGGDDRANTQILHCPRLWTRFRYTRSFCFLSLVYAYRAAVYTLLRPIVFFSVPLLLLNYYYYYWAFVPHT